MDFVYIAAGVLSIGFILLLLRGERKTKELQAGRQTRKEAQAQALRLAKEACKKDLDFEPKYRHESLYTFFLYADHTATKFYYSTFTPDGIISQKVAFNADAVLSLDVDGKTFTKTVTTGSEKTKGGLVRAAIGGATFGAGGAIVGAVTAGKVNKSTSSTTETKGPVTMRIGLSSEEVPLIKLTMDHEPSQDWVTLFRRAIEVS